MMRTLTACAVAACLATIDAQAPFRTGVDVVRIDAVVVDAKGMPIRGLKADDFTILEDGKPRPVVAFEAVDLPVEETKEAGEAAWVRAAPRDVVTNKLEDRRLFMILIDDVMMPSDYRAIERARSIAHDVVSRLGANDQAAVVFSMTSKKSQIFTADHVRLNTAIDATSMGRMFPSAYASAWTLANAVEVLKAAPQTRKTLVLISPGVGLSDESAGPVMSTAAGSSMSSESEGRVRTEVNRLLADALKAHVNVYAFDVNGLDYLTGNPPLPDVNTPQRDYLRTIADNTGGRAFIADDDRVQGVTQMFRESSQYYMLGFSPEATGRGRHRLEVRTNRPDAKVVSRKTFELAAPEKASRPTTPLSSAIGGLLPVDSLPMRVAVTSLPGPTAKEAIVAIALGINQPADELSGAPEKMTAQIEAYQAGGKFVRATKLDAQLTLKPTASGRAQYDLLGKLSLPPGRYQLRIAAHSPRLNVRGSVFADVDVPDFSHDGVTVAPLVLSTSPAPPAAPANAFVGLLPVVPTSHRIFVASDRVSVLARIVEGGKKPVVPLAIDVTVVDTKNRRVFGRSETITPAATIAERSADYVFELPMTTLPAGDYLLTVKAGTAPGANEKTLRFSRR